MAFFRSLMVRALISAAPFLLTPGLTAGTFGLQLNYNDGGSRSYDSGNQTAAPLTSIDSAPANPNCPGTSASISDAANYGVLSVSAIGAAGAKIQAMNIAGNAPDRLAGICACSDRLGPNRLDL